MQTFLPYPNFEETARCLDYRRLGKQRVEAFTILKILRGLTEGGAWKRHPAVRMWEGCVGCLIVYYNTIIKEWSYRGYKNIKLGYEAVYMLDTIPPNWLGRDDFHASHRSNLLRKDYEHYSQFGWEEPPDLPYVWPVV